MPTPELSNVPTITSLYSGITCGEWFHKSQVVTGFKKQATDYTKHDESHKTRHATARLRLAKTL